MKLYVWVQSQWMLLFWERPLVQKQDVLEMREAAQQDGFCTCLDRGLVQSGLRRVPWAHEIAGSNPASPTKILWQQTKL